MTTLKTEVIVLRNRRFSESSLVATLLGREHGRLDVLAKGCRRDKSPMFGHLDLYQREDVLILRRPQAGLDLLTEAAFADEHAGLRFSPPAFAAAGLLTELAAEATLPGEPQPDLFEVLAEALKVLSDLGEAGARAGLGVALPFSAGEKKILIGRIVKLALLDMTAWLGFGLELRRCVICGMDAHGGHAGMSRRQGGVICDRCRSRSGDYVAVGAAALASLRDRDGPSERAELSLPPAERVRWLRFLVDYAHYAIEKPLRGKNVLFQLL